MQVSIPAAPSIVSLPLPSSTSTQTTLSTGPGFYPISILSNLPISKKSRLRDTVLTSPIHVHTPHSHIGTIYASFPGQRVNSLDIFFFLKSLVQNQLSFHGTYVHLSQQMKDEIKAAFYRRHGGLLSSAQINIFWDEFTSGGLALNSPTGEDVFVGCTYIWGLEQKSIHEYSVVHLA